MGSHRLAHRSRSPRDKFVLGKQCQGVLLACTVLPDVPAAPFATNGWTRNDAQISARGVVMDEED
jgi:hypothetical protein